MSEPLEKRNLSILITNFGSGGAEKVVSLLLKKLHHDFNVTLILLYNEIHFQIPDEVEVTYLRDKTAQRPWYKKIIDFIIFMWKYPRTIRKRNIEIAVAFLPVPCILNGILAILYPKLITIISERGFPSDNTTSKLALGISKICYPIFYNRCTSLFSNSVHINRDLYDNFRIRIPMEVIYNPIELPEKKINPNTLEITKPGLNVINVGTLNKRKNQQLILKAFRELGKQYHLTIIGGGHLEDYLNAKIQEFGLENNITMPGRLKNVHDYLIANDCFVLSSYTEGFPNVLLEAMAAGLPVISTNCLSGPLELLNSNNPVEIEQGEFYEAAFGILINNDDHIALIKALKFLMQHPEKRKEYSSLSLRRSKEYSLEKIYEQFNNYLISNK